ncbi:glycoside hydrolase family 76 protein [Zopfia rhizophila CBS 207.26]|uniref:Glycoside hydrolase family 76 protein n=1 Tax=Zopfia rhizophila CBS 207.26 TaxID=1314779 RepID=A0A6A6DCF6_9PEZI|nr:glycoside hydrolase family 76 protein [Zopfia rhizophila CBS 207.26]
MKYSKSLFLLPLLQVSPAAADYADNAVDSINKLNNKWYDANTGLWDKLWWQSANMITAIAKLGSHDGDFKKTASDIVANTYAKAPGTNGGKWTNNFYDDEGWWALGWIASYDMTGDAKYLDTAKSIFEDMTGGWTTPCNGGIWWDKEKTYISAISNELFLSVAAHLANRVSNDKQNYIHWAQAEWDWFSNSGIINGENTVNDGIDKGTCKNNGKTVFTYNQGVVLGGLAELAKATGDNKYIDSAKAIANGAIKKLSVDGILTEWGGVEEDVTLAQFKGVFVRGLAALSDEAPDQSFADYLKKNADTIWSKDRDNEGIFGPRWQGPLGTPNAASHASGIDLLVAAAQA